MGNLGYGAYPTHPGEVLKDEIEERGIKNHVYGCFGSHTWAGTACKRLTEFAETMKWPLVGTPVDNKQAADADTLQLCYDLGKEMAAQIQM